MPNDEMIPTWAADIRERLIAIETRLENQTNMAEALDLLRERVTRIESGSIKRAGAAGAGVVGLVEGIRFLVETFGQ